MVTKLTLAQLLTPQISVPAKLSLIISSKSTIHVNVWWLLILEDKVHTVYTNFELVHMFNRQLKLLFLEPGSSQILKYMNHISQDPTKTTCLRTAALSEDATDRSSYQAAIYPVNSLIVSTQPSYLVKGQPILITPLFLRIKNTHYAEVLMKRAILHRLLILWTYLLWGEEIRQSLQNCLFRFVSRSKGVISATRTSDLSYNTWTPPKDDKCWRFACLH